MEVPFIPKTTLSSIDDPAKINKTGQAKAAGAYSKAQASTAKDEVSISSKSKLMQKLRSEFSKLDKGEVIRMEEVKAKATSGAVDMSAEEIVEEILRGTLFDII